MVDDQLSLFSVQKNTAWKKHLPALGKLLKQPELVQCSECPKKLESLYAKEMCRSCYNRTYSNSVQGKDARKKAIKKYRCTKNGRKKTREANRRHKVKIRSAI